MEFLVSLVRLQAFSGNNFKMETNTHLHVVNFTTQS